MPKKADTKKSTAKKTAAKKTTLKKAPAKKTAAKKAPAKKSAAKKLPANKKSAIKKSPAKKAPAKRAIAKKRTTPISSYKGRKGEKYMSAAMKKHFNAVLIEWREHLREEMQKTFDHLKNKGESYADPIDRASQEEEFAFELRTRDRERKLINKIASSLEQIKQDDYGYCYACGIEIGVKRLEARPTATHCIDCKTLDEIKEKQLGG
jgi:DnaK suppressor protein